MPMEELEEGPATAASSGQAPTEAAQRGEDAYLDPALWSRFGEASSTEGFAAAWLALLCRIVPEATLGVVVLGEPDRGPFAPVAFWPPQSRGAEALSAVAESAMEARRGVVRGPSHATEGFAYPILVDGRLHGVVAIETARRPETARRSVMRQLQWATAWIEVLVRRHEARSRDQLATVVELLAVCLEHQRFRGAATAVATELAGRLECERVSLGFLRGRHIRVEALSHSADFDRRSGVMRLVAEAMEEAVDQQDVVVYPPRGEMPQLTRSHAELAHHQGGISLCTVPLSVNGRVLGAMTLERPPGVVFEGGTVETCARIAALLGPALEARRRDDRWLYAKAWDSLRTQLGNLVGRDHLGLKAGVFSLVALGLFLWFAQGTYRVTAAATLEGLIQRVVTAPMEGYIEEAPVRAGDIVEAGQLLASLDDRDLRLERVKWASQRIQREREYSQALAAHEWARVRILGAQIDQAKAQLGLIDEQLVRTRLVAPFGGVVVSGDLSQRLGSPVSRGEVLFEVAPLEGYRVILEVDERDVSRIAVGQRGQLALEGLPNTRFPFEVVKLTPVSLTEGGRNYFQVEARLDRPAPQAPAGKGPGHALSDPHPIGWRAAAAAARPGAPARQFATNPGERPGPEAPMALLRPGMEGVAKVDIERRRLAWIGTHRAIAWLRLWLWSRW